jgi:hypothetical protein
MSLMPLSPWLIVLEYAAILAGLLFIGRSRCNDIVFGLGFMAACIVMVYSWVGLFSPPVDLRAVIVRYLFFFEGGIAIYLILHSIQQRGNNER